MPRIGPGEEREDVPQFGVILLEQQFNLQQRTRLMTLALLLQDIFNRIQVRLGTLTWSDQRERELCLCQGRVRVRERDRDCGELRNAERRHPPLLCHPLIHSECRS